MNRFIFSLDVITKEIVLYVAKHFNVLEEISKIKSDSDLGNTPYIESFIRSFYVLGQLPVSEVSQIVLNLKINYKVLKFIQTNKDNCIVVTSILDCWVNGLLDSIGCSYYTSESNVKNNKVEKISAILRKENIVNKYKSNEHKIIYTGCVSDDMEAMRLSDISIASGLIKSPAKSIIPVSDYLIFNENALCRQLNQLL